MNEVAAGDQSVDQPGRALRRLRDLRQADVLVIAVCLLAFLCLYVPTFQYWYRAWTKAESYYSHAFLVPFISAFIVWLKRKELAELTVQPSIVGLIVVVAGLLAALVGVWSGAHAPQSVVFPVILWGTVVVVVGMQIARSLVFPIGYLYFMAVMPESVISSLSFKIQLFSTMGSASFLHLLGFDVSRSGVFMRFPDFSVEVGQACSGFRLLISLLALSVLLIYLVEGPKWGKGVLLACMVPVSIALNSFRVTMVALVGNYFGIDAMRGFHDWSGYIMLALALVVLWLIARLVKCQRFSSTLLS